jgi:hypothetical protein
MPLNKEGIAQLKFDLRSNAERYSQDTFGQLSAECGTVCCMAGWCLRREMGEQAFAYVVLNLIWVTQPTWQRHCIFVGARQLGITLLPNTGIIGRGTTGIIGRGAPQILMGAPQIFMGHSHWPLDLGRRYADAMAASDHYAMVEVACDALDRMDEYGDIAALPAAKSVEYGLSAIEEVLLCR